MFSWVSAVLFSLKLNRHVVSFVTTAVMPFISICVGETSHYYAFSSRVPNWYSVQEKCTCFHLWIHHIQIEKNFDWLIFSLLFKANDSRSSVVSSISIELHEQNSNRRGFLFQNRLVNRNVNMLKKSLSHWYWFTPLSAHTAILMNIWCNKAYLFPFKLHITSLIHVFPKTNKPPSR